MNYLIGYKKKNNNNLKELSQLKDSFQLIKIS